MPPGSSPDTWSVDVRSAESWVLLHGTPLTPQVWDRVAGSLGAHRAVHCPSVALAAPARVRSLTVLCSRDTPFPAFEGPAAALRTGALDAAATMARWFRPDEIAANGPVVRYARTCLDLVDLPAWADDLVAIADYDRCDDVSALTMPTLLLAAEHDQVSTPDAMRAMSERIPDARFELVPGAAHMSIFTRPTQLAALLDRAAERAQPSG